jgi:outer membrane protein assembly factor BamD (BamD/ComL family)
MSALGVDEEARQVASVLGYNFPGLTGMRTPMI